jgi:hypothetical protein
MFVFKLHKKFLSAVDVSCLMNIKLTLCSLEFI